MRDTKLYQLLIQVPEAQRKQLALFVASPYFNSVPRISKLLEVLEQHLLRYKVRQLSEQEIFALVLPDQPYDQNRFRKDCSALLKLLLQFLVQQQFDSAAHLHGGSLLRALNQLGIDDHFSGYHQSALRSLDESPARDADLHLAYVQVGFERYLHDVQQPTRNSDENLDALIDHLGQAQVIQKMKLCYLQLNNRLVTGKGKLRDDSEFIAKVTEQLQTLPPRTQMYFHLYRCTLDPELEGEYALFKQLLTATELAPMQRESMYTAALNYCARRLNTGHQGFVRESFAIYQEMLDRKILGAEQRLLSGHFKNIVVVACRLLEFDWARQFVDDHFAELPPQHQRIAHNFSLGCIAFSEGKFAQAEPFLHRVLDDYEDIYFGIDARVILLRSYYETANLIGLESLADSFRMFLKRNTQIDGQRKANLQEFIRHLRRLANLPPSDKVARDKLRQDILKGRAVPNQAWLLSKLDQN